MLEMNSCLEQSFCIKVAILELYTKIHINLLKLFIVSHN